jgi:eukaryotic-like serine/threonine-protein kinase
MSAAPVNLVADRYRLVAPLGQGGMGRVWKARDEVLHRDVAIKELVPPPGLTEDERREMRERSLREARAIAKLSNINVVRVFDVLRTDSDPWIVMEYVASRSLQDVLATDGPVSPVRAAEIGLGVLGALRAAHRAGVMHRDVKPGNVLLGEDGRVVLTDFGLATIPGDPAVTRAGLVLGSPAYIAPERAREGTAGPEADLWSLGATLYAAVEGQSPYARPSAIATLAALATEPPPPSKNAGPLRPVLTGLLRKDPADRISADDADRLLRRAAGRGGRRLSLLDGVRRQSPFGDRQSRTRVLPTPRPPAGPSAEVAAPAAAAAAAAADTASPAAADTASPVAAAPVASAAAAAAAGAPVAPPESPTDVEPDRREPTTRAIGSAPPPVPGLATQTGSSHRRNWLILALAALLALGVALAVALFDGDPGRKPGTQPVQDQGTSAANPSAAGTSPAPQASSPAAGQTGAPPPQPPPAATGNPAPALPAAWRLHSDPTGFKVPVPEGWRESRRTYSWGPQVYFNGPGNRRIKIDQTSTQVRPDALTDLQEDEDATRRRVQDYQRVGEIRRVEGYFADAADWDWLETINGVRMHVRLRNFITTPGKQAYAIEYRLPVSEWDQVGEARFKLIADGFQPRS